MTSSIVLSPDERKTLLLWYRATPDPQLRLRSHLVLLLADGWAWRDIAAGLYCSSETIARWQDRFDRYRLAGLRGDAPGRRPRFAAVWAALVVGWVLTRRPGDFGLVRSRWCCPAVAAVLHRDEGLRVSRETVRRWLRARDLVYRRPRPVLRRQDPDHDAKVAKLRALVQGLPDDETVVYQDEVDVNLNPEIGAAWMPRGQQAEVVTPGVNQKRYLAGSLHARTGRLVGAVFGLRRNSALFVNHLQELRRRLGRYRVIHVVCDNATFHDSRLVQRWLTQQGGRIVLHGLPKYAPECNPVERVWWHLREEITRNHTCATLGELLHMVQRWWKTRRPFVVEDSIYRKAAAA
jgi:transposase